MQLSESPFRIGSAKRRRTRWVICEWHITDRTGRKIRMMVAQSHHSNQSTKPQLSTDLAMCPDSFDILFCPNRFESGMTKIAGANSYAYFPRKTGIAAGIRLIHEGATMIGLIALDAGTKLCASLSRLRASIRSRPPRQSADPSSHQSKPHRVYTNQKEGRWEEEREARLAAQPYRVNEDSWTLIEKESGEI